MITQGNQTKVSEKNKQIISICVILENLASEAKFYELVIRALDKREYLVIIRDNFY